MTIDDDILDSKDHDHEARLQLQLGPPPVSPLGVVPDGVVVLHPEKKIELKIINKKQTQERNFLSNVSYKIKKKNREKERFSQTRTSERTF